MAELSCVDGCKKIQSVVANCLFEQQKALIDPYILGSNSPILVSSINYAAKRDWIKIMIHEWTQTSYVSSIETVSRMQNHIW